MNTERNYIEKYMVGLTNLQLLSPIIRYRNNYIIHWNFYNDLLLS